jgi:hypothetical protein
MLTGDGDWRQQILVWSLTIITGGRARYLFGPNVTV